MRTGLIFTGATLLTGTYGQLREIFQAGNGQALENIAVRRNGDVLFNGIGANATFVLSFKDGRETISQLPALPGVTGLFGITEVDEDVFVVSGGAGSAEDPIPAPGTSVTFAYDFNKDPVAISKVANVPEASLLNGAATIPPRRRGQNGTVLFSDTISGQIFHVDPTTGRYESIFRAEANSSNPAPAFVRPGVNGYEYVAQLQTLFFANTGSILGVTSNPELGSVKLNIRYNRTPLPTITAAEPADIFAPGLSVDDIAVTPRGTVFAAVNSQNTLARVERDGRITNLVVNATNFQAPSATQFGRRREDRDTLYITALGDFVSGGRLFAFTLPGAREDD
ncbi:Hypothetical protein D9617_12g036550 [Elsinoe fawcettii]|nr:Hypothetical protein D9617_12g036550 [Elsinoe fawcettii]